MKTTKLLSSFLVFSAFALASTGQALDQTKPRNECPLSALVESTKENEHHNNLFYDFESVQSEEEIEAAVTAYDEAGPLFQMIIRTARLGSLSTRHQDWNESTQVSPRDLVQNIDYLSIDEIDSVIRADGSTRGRYLVDIGVGNGNGAYLIIEVLSVASGEFLTKILYEDFDGDLITCLAPL